MCAARTHRRGEKWTSCEMRTACTTPLVLHLSTSRDQCMPLAYRFRYMQSMNATKKGKSVISSFDHVLTSYVTPCMSVCLFPVACICCLCGYFIRVCAYLILHQHVKRELAASSESSQTFHQPYSRTLPLPIPTPHRVPHLAPPPQPFMCRCVEASFTHA